MKILIDNGHGENTPGKRSPVWEDGVQLFEWEYAREIARRVETEYIFYILVLISIALLYLKRVPVLNWIKTILSSIRKIF
jgi:hypothetical protein